MDIDIVPRRERRRFAAPILVVAAVLILVALAMGVPAEARPNRDASRAGSGLTLSYEYDNISTFTDLRCYHEDSMHDRLFTGSLGAGEPFTVSLPFCDPERDGASPGGTGFLMAATARGSFTLTATSPSGVVKVAHLMDPVKNKEHRRGCGTPPVARTDGVIMGTIEPGTWSVTIAGANGGQVRDVSLRLLVDMAPLSWQKSNCPSEDWSAH